MLQHLGRHFSPLDNSGRDRVRQRGLRTVRGIAEVDISTFVLMESMNTIVELNATERPVLPLFECLPQLRQSAVQLFVVSLAGPFADHAFERFGRILVHAALFAKSSVRFDSAAALLNNIATVSGIMRIAATRRFVIMADSAPHNAQQPAPDSPPS